MTSLHLLVEKNVFNFYTVPKELKQYKKHDCICLQKNVFTFYTAPSELNGVCQQDVCSFICPAVSVRACSNRMYDYVL